MSRKRRVLLLTKSLSCGGVERVAATLLDALEHPDYVFYLGLLERHADLREQVRRSRALLAPPASGVAAWCTRRDRGYQARAPVRYPYFFCRVRALLREVEPWAVGTMCLDSLIAVAAARALAPPFRWLASIGSDVYENFRSLDSPWAEAVRIPLGFLYRQPDGLAVTSHGLRRTVVDRLGVPSERVAVLPNPVSFERLRAVVPAAVPAPPGRYLLGVGRLVEIKGFDLLLEAFAQVRSRAPDLSLVILGEGRQRRELERLASRLRLGGALRLPGYEPNPWPLMRGATLVVVPSLAEGFSVVIAEAMACGAAVVAADCPHGPRELITPGRDGVLVPPRDAPALAAAILDLLEHPGLREALRARAPHRVREFEAGRVAGRYLQMLENLA